MLALLERTLSATRRATRTLTGHTSDLATDGTGGSAALAVAFSPDGETLAIISAGDVTLWDAATERTSNVGESRGSVAAVAFSLNGKTLAIGTYGGTVILLDFATTRTRATLKGRTRDVVEVVFSSDGKTLATCSLDGTAPLWDLATSRRAFTFTFPDLTPTAS
ncbi:WD40 repeat domain-containing protein [Streptomyces sp. NPDC058284]|uniref:WD40 repeat domain-containing protein n=1 Tax=unclassified Streptomyces TaxID=2593676 RepID=UPI00364A6A4B